MKLSRLEVRFFRSFNYDYELKSRDEKQPATWEDADPAWYPFVRVALDPEITAIVGANESGKSQLLIAIKAALSGSPIERVDFCRYSELYSVKTGEMRLPEFGGTFVIGSEDERPDLPALATATEFTLYRPGSDPPFLVVDGHKIDLDNDSLKLVEDHVPNYHELKTDLAIPDSVSIAELAGDARHQLQDRRHRLRVLETLQNIESPTQATVGEVVFPELISGTDEATLDLERKRLSEFELSRQLLVDVAGIDQNAFRELQEAIASGREGQVEAIIGAMNSAIKENLNFQRWWSQDRDFNLMVEAREQELAFTILDRTGSKYSFGERSQGLRFFLSYFVQLTAHRLRNQKPDILLLDEPDAFLSSVGQQDLLRVLHEYAIPEDGGQKSQVVYVTHSPFLIDKNAPHRIRVLDKGSEDEGTRVVRDAANNRYEPLRSSLGAHVAETAFIGGRNLFVEGPSDQILLTGISAQIVKKQQSVVGTLDLNSVTVVSAGGADSIPYMVYLARGRDAMKPPCVVLLDGDTAGKQAEQVLKRGEARKKRVLQDRYIVRLDTWASTAGIEFDPGVVVQEIEDLVPIVIAHRAALNYLARFNNLHQLNTAAFTPERISAGLESYGGRLWEALHNAYQEAFPEEHLEKAGLAKEIVLFIEIMPDSKESEVIRQRFGALTSLLSDRLDDAATAEDRDRSDDRLKRAVKNFSRNHPSGMKKYDANKLIREIESALATSSMGDSILSRVFRISRSFELDDLASPNVPRFAEFREQIKALSSSERVAYQDDALKDPAAEVIPSPAKIFIPDAKAKTAR